MAQNATLINPSTGEKRVVEGGSREATDLFGRGFQLMGSDGKPVPQGPRPPLAPSASTPTSTPPPTSRAPETLFPGITNAPAAKPPDFQGVQNFNTKLMDLLGQYQGLDSVGLLKYKNALLKSQYGKLDEITDEELRNFSPEQQRAIRESKGSALTGEIENVNEKLAAYEGKISRFGDILNVARGIGQDIFAQEQTQYETQQSFQKGIQDQVFTLIGTFGSKAFDGIDEDGLNEIEQYAGLPLGTLGSGLKGLAEKERQADPELAAIREIAFRPETLEAGVAPRLFLENFPDLISTWEAMSNVARGRLDIEKRASEADIADALRGPVRSGGGGGSSGKGKTPREFSVEDRAVEGLWFFDDAGAPITGGQYAAEKDQNIINVLETSKNPADLDRITEIQSVVAEILNGTIEPREAYAAFQQEMPEVFSGISYDEFRLIMGF